MRRRRRRWRRDALWGNRRCDMLYFGRIANALVAAALVILALRLIPFQRDCLWAVALLPMTLSQMGSVAADAIMFAVAFVWLALALAFNRNSATPVGWREGATLLVAAVAVGQLRPPYCLLALLAVEPRIWRRDFDPRRRYFCLAAVGLAGCLRRALVPGEPALDRADGPARPDQSGRAACLRLASSLGLPRHAREHAGGKSRQLLAGHARGPGLARHAVADVDLSWTHDRAFGLDHVGGETRRADAGLARLPCGAGGDHRIPHLPGALPSLVTRGR